MLTTESREMIAGVSPADPKSKKKQQHIWQGTAVFYGAVGSATSRLNAAMPFG